MIVHRKITILFSFIITFLVISNTGICQTKADTTGLHKVVLTISKSTVSNEDSIITILDSIINIYEQLNPSKELAFAYRIYGKNLLNSGQHEKALDAFYKGLAIASKTKDTSNLIKLYQITGVTFMRRAQFDSVKKYYSEGYKLALKYSDSTMLPIMLSEMGSVKIALGDFDSSIFFLYKAEPLFQKQKNYFRLSILYNSLGILYQYTKNFKRSMEYYKKGIAVIDSTSDKRVLPSILTNIGELYFNQELYDSAYIYYQRALENINTKTDPVSYYIQINNIGNYFLITEQYEKAISYYKKVQQSNYFNVNNQLKTAVITNLGNAYYRLGKLDSAKILTNNGLKYAKDNHLLEFEKNSYTILTAIDTINNNWKDAYYHHIKYDKIRDSLINKKTLVTIDSLHSTMELTKNIVQNELLMRENETKSKQVLLQKIGLMVLLLTLLFIITILIVVTKNKKKITKLHADLADKNKIISEKNSILHQANEELTQLNEMKNKFFTIVSHDLRSPFNSILGFLDILNSQYEDSSIQEEEKQKIVQLVLNTAEGAFSLLQNLLNWSLVQQGKISVKKQPVKLLHVIEKSIELHHLSSKEKNITIETDIEQNLFLTTDKQLLNNIFNNLLNNAIKFTHNGGVIKLFTERTDEHIKICISDKGTGIPEDKIANLFYAGSTYKQKGTNHETGTGLGLILCKEYATLLGGTIKVKSKPGIGSCFCLILPKTAITDVSK